MTQEQDAAAKIERYRAAFAAANGYEPAEVRLTRRGYRVTDRAPGSSKWAFTRREFESATLTLESRAPVN